MAGPFSINSNPNDKAMKKIILKKLSLSYFKGIRKKEIEFSQETSLCGANESGKTSIFDAFCYLLFGKDSSDRTAFGIKTLVDGQALEKVDHEVSGVLEVDGKEITLKKTYREKWVKERGSKEPVMKGHENLFEWDGVPVKEQDYKASVSALVNEGIFKLITNPLYFNSLDWQKRRQILIGLTPEITYAQVAEDDPDFLHLLQKMGDKTIDQYKAQISASKKRLKDESEKIPTRIDELHRSLQSDVDFDQLLADIEKETERLAKIDTQIRDKSEAVKAVAEKNVETQNKIYEHRRAIDKIKHDIRSKIEAGDRDATKDIDALRSKYADEHRKIEGKKKELADLNGIMGMESIPHLTKRREELINIWHEIDQKKLEFDDHEFNCPTCKRALDPEDIKSKKEELTANFNRQKAADLAEIERKGQAIKTKLEAATDKSRILTEEIATLEAWCAETAQKIEAMKPAAPSPIEERVAEAVANDHNIKALEVLIESLERDIKVVTEVDTTELLAQEKEARAKLSELNRELAKKDLNDQTRIRIDELKAEEKDKAQELADIENVEFTIDRFVKAMMDRVEENINSLFKYVRFKLFNSQVNGAEVPACETTYKGVPWGDLNTAGKIWAGIDIINTLSKFYGVSAPLWLDNRESTTEIPETESQIINLVVDPTNKSIAVKHHEFATA